MYKGLGSAYVLVGVDEDSLARVDSRRNSRTNSLSADGLDDIPFLLEIKNQDREFMRAALRDGCRVHDLEILLDDGVVVQFAIKDCVRIFFWVLAVDAIDPSSLQDNIGFEFQAGDT